MWRLSRHGLSRLFGGFKVPVVQIQYDVLELLRRAGATIRSRNRADCPRCGKRRAVSYATQVFHCHHTGCNFQGNAITLARDLGLLKPLSSRDAEKLKRTRDLARYAAEELSFRLRERRLPLQEEHRRMLDILHGGEARLKRDQDPKIGQAIIAYAKRQLRKIRAQLAILEDSPMPQRLEFLNANEGRQKGMVCAVIAAGGVEDTSGKFIEVE